MKDKDKLILLFNIPVNRISQNDASTYVASFAKEMSGFFDDSVKTLFSATWDEAKPAVQAVTDFPSSGVELVLQMEKYIKEGNTEELKSHAQALCDIVKSLQEENTE